MPLNIWAQFNETNPKQEIPSCVRMEETNWDRRAQEEEQADVWERFDSHHICFTSLILDRNETILQTRSRYPQSGVSATPQSLCILKHKKE